MKRILISLMFVMLFVIISCGGEEYSCNYGGQCPNHGGTWDACCTSSDCYYEVIDRTFECEGTNCQTAAQELQSYCFEKDTEKWSRTYCEKMFACEETAEIRPGESVDECIDFEESILSEYCLNYNSSKSDECISCYNGLSCAEFSAYMQDDESTTCAVCGEICE